MSSSSITCGDPDLLTLGGSTIPGWRNSSIVALSIRLRVVLMNMLQNEKKNEKNDANSSAIHKSRDCSIKR